MRRFEGKVVLVTGAASGIGRATAQRLAQEGARLLCVDVQTEQLAETARTAAASGVDAVAHVCDVSNPAQCEAAVAACIERFGRLDCLCNIAGILQMSHSLEVELEDWNRILAVNLTGTFLMCKAALPHLLESKGTIVNTASTAALAGLPWGAAYAASKGGILALTHALAVEFAKHGVRVNAVCPGSVRTPMGSRSKLPQEIDAQLVQRLLPLDKPRGPETVAGVIAMLASEDGAHIIGEHIRVDGGMLC